MEPSSSEDVAAALDGDDASRRALVTFIARAVQAEVVLMMTRYGSIRGRDGRQEVQDLVQEVFVVLLKDGAKTLRSWRPDGGRKFGSFVRLVAKRRLLSLMRTQSKNPWPDEPTEHATLERRATSSAAEPQIAHREELELLWTKLRRWFQPDDHALFRMFFVEGLSIEEVERATGRGRQSLYAWRRKLREFAREVRTEARAG